MTNLKGMEPYKIFIVEDNAWYADILEYQLTLNPDYEVTKFTTGKECLKNLYKHPSVVTLDYSLPDISGREVLAEIKKFNQDIPVVMISGQEDIKIAVKLLKEGAYDYIVKDKDTIERIWNAINKPEKPGPNEVFLESQDFETGAFWKAFKDFYEGVQHESSTNVSVA